MQGDGGAPGPCRRASEGQRSPVASAHQPRDVPCPRDCGQSGSLLGEPQGHRGAALTPLSWGDRGGQCQDESPSARLPSDPHAPLHSS